MYELKLATKEIRLVQLPADAKYGVRMAFNGGQTILATDSDEQKQRWLDILKVAGVRPVSVTSLNVDPIDPDPALVARLATDWSDGATKIEDEMCVGWVSSEPTPFLRAVSLYLSQNGQLFDKRMFQHLD